MKRRSYLLLGSSVSGGIACWFAVAAVQLSLGMGMGAVGAGLAWAGVPEGIQGDALLADTTPFEPPRVVVSSTAAGTFMGIEDELLLDNIHTQPISEVKFNHGGSSISLRLTFADGSRAAFKPMQTNPQTIPRKEIAAYRLNRLLGLNNVPPAVARTLHREDLFAKIGAEPPANQKRIVDETTFDDEGFTRGEVSYWIPVIVNSNLDAPESVEAWSQWLSVGVPIPHNKVSLMAQLSTLLVFDLIENNSDRFSGGNLMASADGKTLYYMDNTFGFQIEPEGHIKCRTMLFRAQKFSRRFIDALRELDRGSIRRALAGDGGVLTDEELASVLARREVAIRYVDGLISHYGVDKVLVFP